MKEQVRVTWDPDLYAATIRDEIHDYDELQTQVVNATEGQSPRRILELGIGAGETARRMLEAHPGSRLVGIDSSAEMLRGAEERLPMERVTLVQQDLSDELPQRKVDIVLSALAVHHLEGEGKAELFRRVAAVLTPGGVFVMGDVVVPEDPADALIENEPGYDFPSTVEEQLRWIGSAGFDAEVTWRCKDLAVIRAVRSEDR